MQEQKAVALLSMFCVDSPSMMRRSFNSTSHQEKIASYWLKCHDANFIPARKWNTRSRFTTSHVSGSAKVLPTNLSCIQSRPTPYRYRAGMVLFSARSRAATDLWSCQSIHRDL